MAGLVLAALLGAAATVSANPAELPADPVSSSEAKRVCPEWGWRNFTATKPDASCRITWAWLDDDRRLSRVHYQWAAPLRAHDRDDYHLEVLFEELPGDLAWALFGLKSAGFESYVTDLALEVHDGHLVISAADCLDGTAGCTERYEYEWPPGGKLVAVRSHIDEDMKARLRVGYDLLACEVTRSNRGAVCSACRTGDLMCCPRAELLVGLRYVSDVGWRLKAVREADYDAPCEGPVRQREPPD